MAQSERFYFWRGYYEALRKLPDAESRDAFVMAICRYAFENEEPDFSGDRLLDFAWSLVSEQVHESVEIGRKMAERGRRSGESRRNKGNGANSVRNSVRNEVKGTEVTGTEDASRLAPNGAALASFDGDSDEY
jgi:hypothetical protein